MMTKILVLLSLIFLGIIDVLIPLPLIGIMLIYVVLKKPLWFRNLIRQIYNESDNGKKRIVAPSELSRK